MDIVITFVNGNDPVWRADYEKHTNRPLQNKRFRDWGTLKYLLRGIEKNMPFIENVYIVVSHESQIPEWADRKRLRTVLHKDIIPDFLLPTFNANPIETHLHNIRDLSEQFLFFNDDIFPMRPCRPEDFFREGKIRTGFSKHILCAGMFRHITRNSDRLARKALGMKKSCMFIRQQHICTPLLKSEVGEVYRAVEKDLLSSLTMLRESKNVNQYLFTDYMFYKGAAINEKLSRKHISLASASAKKVRKAICNPSEDLLCINDVNMSDERFAKLHRAIISAFEESFPEKSSFEL